MPSPLLLIVAGPNGSGKTTLVRQGVLAAHLDVPLGSINPDDVARDLAGGGAPTADISLRAAQICDGRLDDEIEAGRSVTVETVLSSDKLKQRVETAKSVDFRVALVYVTLRHPALHVARVRQRHALGGHDVPAERVLRRRERSHELFAWFAERADLVLVFDNTAAPVYTAGKADGVWDLAASDRLPEELAATLRRLAG